MQHFKPEEFRCRCGKCNLGFNAMQPSTLKKLSEAREHPLVIANGVQFTLLSAVRCLTHNKEVGGAKLSTHLTGNALDIAASDSRTRFIILKALMDAGFTRIGLHKLFIHADDAPYSAKEVVWFYPQTKAVK